MAKTNKTVTTMNALIDYLKINGEIKLSLVHWGAYLAAKRRRLVEEANEDDTYETSIVRLRNRKSATARRVTRIGSKMVGTVMANDGRPLRTDGRVRVAWDSGSECLHAADTLRTAK